MRRAADRIPENIEFVAAELLAAPADRRPAMLEQIAKALTRRLLQEQPRIGSREVSERVSRFVEAVCFRMETNPATCRHIRSRRYDSADRSN
jgi:hypothetical protein